VANIAAIRECHVEEIVEPEPAFEGGKLDRGEISSAWRDHDNYVRIAVDKETPESCEFDRTRVHVGHPIDPELADRLLALIDASESEPYINEDFAPGFQTFAFPPEVVAEINRGSSLRVFNVQSSWAIQDALDAMRDEVAAALGTPWKIINVRAWTTKPEAQPKGMYAWHSDGYEPEIFKILLYLTPMSPQNGYVEVRVDGRTKRLKSSRGGLWALLDPTNVIHRGVPGTERERVLLEMTICRSAAFDLRARYPGQNSHWPSFPWTEATGCSNLELQRIAEWSKWPIYQTDSTELRVLNFLRFRVAELLCSLAKVLTPLAKRFPATLNMVSRLDAAGADMWNRAKSNQARRDSLTSAS
jgi:hypothetical protein